MKITINGQSYVVYEYDDDTTLLERYSLSKEDTVPSFFRVENKDFLISEGVALDISDVRDTIKDLSGQDLSDPTIKNASMIKNYQIG